MTATAAVSNAGRASAKAPLAAEQAMAGAAESEALCVTHWFDARKEGEPYSATVRFSGRRIGIRGKPTPRDTFVKEETIHGIVPGSGRVSITSLAYGLEPGAWTVTADLLRRATPAGGPRSADHWSRIGAQPLPRAAWSWRRWALQNGAYSPLNTRWGPLVRMARMPAVIHGSWSGLIALGVLVGAAVQAVLLARANDPVGPALIVDLLALVSGLLVAKLWYIALQPRRSWRKFISEGWTVDGLLLAAPAVAAAVAARIQLADRRVSGRQRARPLLRRGDRAPGLLLHRLLRGSLYSLPLGQFGPRTAASEPVASRPSSWNQPRG